MNNNNKNKRGTLTLGNKSNDLKGKIGFIARDGSLREENQSSSGNNKNINDFLKNTKFNNISVIQNRQKELSKKEITEISADKSVAVKKTENNVSQNTDPVDDDPQKNAGINIHQLLATSYQKQREEKEKKQRDEILKREVDARRKQEEELRRFNAKGRMNHGENNENNENAENNRGEFKKHSYNNNNNGGGNNNNNNNGRNNYKKDFKKNDKFPDKNPKTNNTFTKNKFLIPTPQPMDDPKRHPYKKDDYNKKTYKDDEESAENKRAREKKITYILGDDDESFAGRRRKKSFFKNKEKRNDLQHEKIIQSIELPEFLTVSNLADKMGEKRADVVKKLISMGMPVTINQTIDADTAELVIAEFGHTVKKRVTEHDIENTLENEDGKNIVARAPVVTIMGHVDHGKTSLLDSIRTTKVVEGESGGITQHIGASRVEVSDSKFITFIDTPGHEAFTEMRMRGANITDIVVLVVAADDGVKDQTIEAISHAKSANAPIILAINKIDKHDSNPKKVKEELLQHDVVVEEFGGDVMVAEVSAKENIGLDKLKETILLQAEIMNLRAPIDVKASGVVIESHMDQNKGAVATLLVQRGILKDGDLVLVGISYGKIKKMVDSKAKIQKEASPSMAVEILGLDTVPLAGTQFNVVSSDKEARDIVAYRTRKVLENKVAKRNIKTLDSMLKVVGGKSAKLLPLIIKADVSGSIEAIANTLTKLNNSEVEIDIVHSATGAINETDINLANVSNALVIGFNVRASNSITELAKTRDVEIRYYSIIYNIVDDIKRILSGLLDPIIKEEITSHVEIRQVFKVSGVGNIAGCFVLDGELSRTDKIRLIRDGIVIHTGEIKALKRFKDDVKEVKNGYECGISIESYNDIKEKDIIEGFRVVEEKREL